MMRIENLRELYVEQLRDLHSAERQIIEALPKMVKAASNPDLQFALDDHLNVSTVHLARLDQILAGLGEKGTGKTCKGIEGLLEEGKEALEGDMLGEVRDAAIIAAARRVEHYEIAAYGTVRTYADLLGETRAARLLHRSLDEEGDADEKLTDLAKTIPVEVEVEVEVEAEVLVG
jgi:ferritin-like metal-binding protein YciE